MPSGLILGSDFANGLFVLKLVDHVEGVADLTRDQLNVYPNTVSRMCFVQVSKEFKNAQLSVYDNMGKIIERFNTENYSLINLDMSHYVAGIYHVEVIKGGKKLTRKIIKKYS